MQPKNTPVALDSPNQLPFPCLLETHVTLLNFFCETSPCGCTPEVTASNPTGSAAPLAAAAPRSRVNSQLTLLSLTLVSFTKK